MHNLGEDQQVGHKWPSNPSGGSFANIKSNWVASGLLVERTSQSPAMFGLTLGYASVSLTSRAKAKQVNEPIASRHIALIWITSFFRTWKSCFPFCFKHQYSGSISINQHDCKSSFRSQQHCSSQFLNFLNLHHLRHLHLAHLPNLAHLAHLAHLHQPESHKSSL